MRCLPGLYGENTIARDLTAGSAIDATPIPFPDSISLLDQNSTHRKAIMVHGSQSAIETHLARQRLTSLTFPQPTSSANNHSLRQQGSDDSNSWRRLTTRVASEHEPVDYHVGNIKRWMAVIKVPYYNKQTRLTEEGFCCRACSNLAGRRGYWRRRFNSQTWDDHIREYGEIVGSKHVSPTLPNPSGNAAAVGA
ncbi:hypothetical protein BGW36DRAFT_390779 [Talaromyces proteolyticus]|uniref:Uncharacterized protein n=1 Tax=Talaromyces proteolyticus TaxID=1131652 RepID=A0AAD4KFV3_9EURO|nr:uncharacterized protein BGW36DRAFT_390779 [Talaromyces proteolyticus]KAH8689396.1 hypothetical protein BGW36DRAFT_390779 [Talaromyces proteolyticus]